MKKLILFIATIFFIILFLLYNPLLFLIFLLVNLILISIKGLFQLRFSLFRHSSFPHRHSKKEHFISIHIAAHNEPPHILINTLKSIAKLKYRRYEVIVVDNNTKDEDNWKQIQAYCKNIGKNFRFFHIDNLKGFKAGALNFAKEKMNPAAEFIAVIDSDYEVSANFMRLASKYFTDKRIAFVQFPQAYKNADKSNIGLTLEYRHFFQTYMNMGNYYNCVTSTGTLSIFKVSVLRKIGYFKPNYITEDAEIGLRLNLKGYRGLYIPKIIGRGLIPYDIASYKKQKSRWALGNIQILKHSILQLLFDNKLSAKQKIGLLSQLSAWINFTILPIFTVIAAALLRLLPNKHFYLLQPIIIMSGFSIFFFLFLKIVSFYSIFHNKYSLSELLKAYFIHIGMGGSIYSLTTIQLFWKTNYIFERTNKFILPETSIGIIRNVFFELFLGISSMALSIYHFFSQRFAISLILFMVSIIYLAIIYILKELKMTKLLSIKLFKQSLA